MRRGVCIWRLLTAMAVMAVAFAPAAWATDGTVLITQATASHGLPGCPVTSFPIVICQPGSYKLGSNLTVPYFQSVISITAPNVTLDLNGFTITEQVLVQGGQAITDSAWNLTVMNGTIYGIFSSGIKLDGDGLVVKSVTIEYISGGAAIYMGGSGMVMNSFLLGNFDDGIYVAADRPVTVLNTVIGNSSVGLGHALDMASSGKNASYGGNTFSNFTNGDVFGSWHSMKNNICSTGAVC